MHLIVELFGPLSPLLATSRSKVDRILMSPEIKPKDVREVIKSLMVIKYNEEIIQASERDNRRFSSMQRVVLWKITKKYRLQSGLQKYTTLNLRKTYHHT